MVQLAASFELTTTQRDALAFEAHAEEMTIEEMIGWIVRQNILPLLDVMETEHETRREELLEKLRMEEAHH